MTRLNRIKEPESVSEALCDPKWKHAMDKEMEALRNSKTWILIDLPINRESVGCK